jgi:hypothetical protein
LEIILIAAELILGECLAGTLCVVPEVFQQISIIVTDFSTPEIVSIVLMDQGIDRQSSF